LHRLLVSFLILLTTLDSGCGSRPAERRPLPKWEFGFWHWGETAAPVPNGTAPPDHLYVHVGRFENQRFFGSKVPWQVYGNIPERLPIAKTYWLVFRFDSHTVPAVASVPVLMQTVGELKEEARTRGIRLAGIQLDIDVPTSALRDYATYLKAVRKGLSPDFELSITALLDWFRAGTWVGNVVDAVDEFVPQFYDLQARGSISRPSTIGAFIDAEKWRPLFNLYGKRFRIGVSTFGRSKLIPAGKPSWVDLKPLDVAMDPAFVMETSETESKETILRFRAARNTRISYTEFAQNEGVEFILSTPDAIRTAVKQAKKMGEYCAGVVFFRWPTFNESMVLEPDAVLAAATSAPVPVRLPSLRAIDEQCASVHCSDLYLADTPGLRPNPIRYVIEVSSDLEYFLPDESTPARMTGPRRLEFTLPPFGGRTQIHLGRAVTANFSKYTLKATP